MTCYIFAYETAAGWRATCGFHKRALAVYHMKRLRKFGFNGFSKIQKVRIET
jgi:hypothetical protein